MGISEENQYMLERANDALAVINYQDDEKEEEEAPYDWAYLYRLLDLPQHKSSFRAVLHELLEKTYVSSYRSQILIDLSCF